MAITPSPTKPLEPGAVAGPMPANALPASPVPGPAPWGALDGSVAPNFVSVQTVLLPAGTTLRRVFGYPDAADPWPSWEVGSWWTRQPLPASEAEWRAQYAVEAQWNGGQCVADWTTPQDIHAWAGPAAAQAGEYADGEPAPGCHLPGGAEQIYIAPAQSPLGTWQPGPTPWQAPPKPPAATAAASVAAPAAPTPTPTVATLTTAVSQLGAKLQDMAKEAAGKGLDGGAFEFQARQLKRVQARLGKFNTPKTAPHLRAVLRGLAGLARHVQTSHPWSTQSAAAGDALRTVVVQASALARAA